MIRPGLVSVTFRHLDVAQVLDVAREGEVEGIEWGGDVHVPHGDLATAEAVGEATRAAGMDVAAYGSYYYVGASQHDGPPFEDVLDTALALGAPLIRVWPGRRGSSEADDAYRSLVVDDSRRIAELAGQAGVTLAYEHHANSLTDTPESSVDLLRSAGHPRMRTLWQPPVGATADVCMRDLQAALPWLVNVHVFHVWPTAADRRPLHEGEPVWRRYLDMIASTGRAHWLLLEFVRDDDTVAFLEDAATLIRWLGER